MPLQLVDWCPADIDGEVRQGGVRVEPQGGPLPPTGVFTGGGAVIPPGPIVVGRWHQGTLAMEVLVGSSIAGPQSSMTAANLVTVDATVAVVDRFDALGDTASEFPHAPQPSTATRTVASRRSRIVASQRRRLTPVTQA